MEHIRTMFFMTIFGRHITIYRKMFKEIPSGKLNCYLKIRDIHPST